MASLPNLATMRKVLPITLSPTVKIKFHLSRVVIFCTLLSTSDGLAGALAPATKEAAGPRPPNILFILADDLGWNQVGYNGSSFYRTPHIDRLAREGLRFSAAYAACPVCSPTRAALMTGKYPARLHLTDYIHGTPYPWARLQQPDWNKYLPLSEETLAEALAAHGYVTGLFGKWHLAKNYVGPESIEHGPDRQGFQETFITHKPNEKSDPEGDAHGVEAITTRAIDFLKRHRDKPFFLELAHNSVHAPVMAPSARVAKFKAAAGSDRPENNPVIGAMMEILDEGIGRVLEKVDEFGLREKTIVVFHSDNGGLLADAAQTPLRGGKAQLYEGGVRVPLVIRWPGVVAPGRSSSVPVTTVDFFPTFLELAGDSRARGLDGISLTNLLRGQPAPDRKAIFWHYPHYHAAGNSPSGAIRAGAWKLIEYYETELTGTGPALELFNLEDDPSERTNLAADQPQKVAELKAMLSEWLHATGAQHMTLNPNYDPARAGLRNANQDRKK